MVRTPCELFNHRFWDESFPPSVLRFIGNEHPVMEGSSSTWIDEGYVEYIIGTDDQQCPCPDYYYDEKGSPSGPFEACLFEDDDPPDGYVTEATQSEDESDGESCMSL